MRRAASPRDRAQPQRAPGERPAAPCTPVAAVLALQRSAGNRAVARHVSVLPPPDSSETPMRLDLAGAAALVRRNGLGDKVRHAALAELDAADAKFPTVARLLAQAQALSAERSGPTVDEMAEITKRHTELIAEANKQFASDESRMLRGIVSGSSFSSKMDEAGELVKGLKAADVEELKARSAGFLGFAAKLPARAALPLYRTIKPTVKLKPGVRLRHALPFSSTFSFSFARGWAHTADYVVLEFEAPPAHAAVALSQLGDLTGTLKPINQEQLEVTVAPATIRITDGPVERHGRRVYKAVLEPISSAEIGAAFDDAIAKRKASEAEAPTVHQLDASELANQFEEPNVAAIVALGPRLATETIPTEQRTFVGRDGRTWELVQYDDRFGYDFTVWR
jgi:hypothetical protein